MTKQQIYKQTREKRERNCRLQRERIKKMSSPGKKLQQRNLHKSGLGKVDSGRGQRAILQGIHFYRLFDKFIGVICLNRSLCYSLEPKN